MSLCKIFYYKTNPFNCTKLYVFNYIRMVSRSILLWSQYTNFLKWAFDAMFWSLYSDFSSCETHLSLFVGIIFPIEKEDCSLLIYKLLVIKTLLERRTFFERLINNITQWVANQPCNECSCLLSSVSSCPSASSMSTFVIPVTDFL